MKKILSILAFVFLTLFCSSCSSNLDPIYDSVLPTKIEESLTLTEGAVLLETSVSIYPKDHEKIKESVMFDITHSFDTNIFNSSYVSNWGGRFLKLVLKDSAYKSKEYDTYISFTFISKDREYSKTISKSITIPSGAAAIGTLYVNNQKYKSFKNYYEKGFYLKTQSVSSGHFYTDRITELDFENKTVKYTVDKYEKNTSGDYNHKIQEAIYNFETQKITFKNGTTINVSELDTSDDLSFERALGVVIKAFDKVFKELEFYEYVSCLS